MAAQASLLVVDRAPPERAEPDPAVVDDMMIDLNMMTVLAGRERTASEFKALLTTAGLRLERVISLPIPDKLIEAVPT
jgi:hypothetical protein